MLKTLVAQVALVAGLACAQGGGVGVALTERELALAAFEALPETTLKAIFMRCDLESSVRLMALDEGAQCAMAWDALLRRGFGGDVDALLAWWRGERIKVNRKSQ